MIKLPPSAKPGFVQNLGQLPGDSPALAITELAKQADGLIVVITSGSGSTESLCEEIRFFSGAADAILHFPDRETLPYDNFSPHQDIISERLLALYQLPQRSHGVLVIPVSALMHKLPPADYITSNSLMLACGDKQDISSLRRNLDKAGYRCVETVMEHGEYAVRGSLVDLYPMGSKLPYRVDFFDNEIETLRTFEPDTQRTVDKIDSIKLLPARETPLDSNAISTFKDGWHSHFNVDHRHCPIYQDVAEGIAPPGVEYYLPLFFDQTMLLTDYLPPQCTIVFHGEVHEAAERFWQDANGRFEDLNIDARRPLLPPGALFSRVDELFGHFKTFGQYKLHSDQPTTLALAPCPPLEADARKKEPWAKLQDFHDSWPGRLLFSAESAGRREALAEQLASIDIRPAMFDSWLAFLASDAPLGITVAPLGDGFLVGDGALALVPEAQLLGQRVAHRDQEQKAQDITDSVVRNLAELRAGSPVVHIDHGVGRYRGLQVLEVDGDQHEFLLLEYADEAKLYVPVSSLHLINRFTGSEDELAPLHKLGSDSWARAREKAARQIRDAAAELLELYAKRAARTGRSLKVAADVYTSFAADFPFEETPDQATAIEAVIGDMAGETPMDRLICGDVGFGKTEVAMRAAFIAVQNGMQVAVLVPTTLLAQQHYDSFRDRFADSAINIAVMSRFRSAKEQAAARDKLESGNVDIVIGTHKLLQGDINYNNLGLVIVDEEHRFGVKQKEVLKNLRTEVDILNLTATPIPRTLNMSLAGMRDLSIIATPPAKRLAIRTFVREYDKAVIKEAILRELLRGGQVFYVHNDVSTIERTARELGELIPEARIAIGHGQMRERELEQVMSDFYHKKANVLLCTTIIETGIDIPSANTMIIARADKFGLAQLHQLRGRVGRSHHQAYAYLLTPHYKSMTADATKRLEAIAETQDLGAGFVLATHDLEIRGAGELLGDEQSGHIQKIGFTMYMDMLDRAVQTLKQGKELSDKTPVIHETEVNLNIAAILPHEYLPDVHMRLTLYKRIANARSEADLRALQVEMIDRFGLLPEQAKYLFRVTGIKLEADQLGINKVEAGARGGKLAFDQDTPVDPLVLVKLVQGDPQCYRLAGNELRFSVELMSAEDRIDFVTALLKTLQTAAA